MLLAIDIGNTNIVIGCIKDDTILFNERVATDHTATDLEYAIQLNAVTELHRISRSDIEAAIISSVVPDITDVMKNAIKKLIGVDALVVGPGIKTGLSIRIDNPAQLGSDLAVDAVAGLNFYKVPLIIIDMGTATTVSVIDKDSNYIGGMIIPGMRASLDSLAVKTAQLPKIRLDMPERIIGKNTVECMQSGILEFTACGIDGSIRRIEKELGYPCTVVATGGLSGYIVPLCDTDIIYDEDLLLKGLMIIYNKNK